MTSTGSIGLDLGFKTATEKSYQLIIYQVYNNILSVDKFRNVKVEYNI